jgi:hypothetical protein
MGVTDASKWLRERIAPLAETEDTIMDHLRERTPDGDGLAFIVDGGRFAHAPRHTDEACLMHGRGRFGAVGLILT